MSEWDAFPVAGQDVGVNPNTGRPAITVRPQSPHAEAISSIESGGNYRAVGPVTRNGDRAVGKYQVMGRNVPEWTKEVLGQEMTPLQFLANQEAQDAVFNAKFGSYVEKYGPEGAAKAWFAGEKGMNDPNRRDVLGTSVADYGRKFAAAGGGQQAPVPQQQSSDPWAAFPTAAPQPQTPPAGPVAERFAETPPPANAAQLQPALQQRATEMMQGPAQSPAAQMATDFSNIVPAASQRTSPHVSNYGGQLISKETFEDDGGNILYRDPETGKLKRTDQATQVAIRDPADGIVKVFARSEATNEGALSGAARVASAGMLAGAPTARAMIPAAPKALQPKASEIFATAKPYYRAFKNEAGKIEIPAETATEFAGRLRGSLEKANLIEELAPSVYKAVAILDKGEPLTLDALQNVKRVVGRSFSSPDKNVRDAAGVVSGEIGKIISEVSKSASQNLKTGDAIHSTARSVQDLQRKSEVADLRAGRAGYGGNAVNSMRQVLSPIVQRAVEGRTTGFKPDEIKAMRDIVEGTTATNALRGVGQLSPSKGVIQTVGAGGAMYAMGPAALAIPALGAASNKVAAILTGKQIDQLKELVAKRSPAYAEAVSKAVQRYESAQIELMNNPAPNKLAAYLSASRALSAGLSRDGIQITSGELLKAIQGPIKSAAEGDEPAVPGHPGE